MKRNLLTLLTAAFALMTSAMSCGSDEPDTPAADEQKLEIASCSIADGATVQREAASAVTLTYSADITIADPAGLTVNGSKAASEAKGRQLTITMTPDYDKEYVVEISRYAVRMDGKGTFGPAFKLTFRTEKYQAPDVPVSDIAPLTNAAASDNAKAVYDCLRASYGRYIISGAMANVSNNNDFADWIYAVSGKYPALAAYDFIHLPSSPANWIDYSDISAARAQWQNGGLVSYMWHWLTPDTEGSADLKYDSYFDINAALTEGTWQNKLILADIDRVAGYLKLLKDAGIPVIWRPLHEAAGDKTWGAWFWWGRGGAEPCKRLWRLLYQKLTVEYQLDNLIWVWTVQTTDQGQLADLSWIEQWYPGDDVVDIIGVDLYKDSHLSCAPEFNLLNLLGNGKKLVTLAETGMLPDPGACMADKSMWSWAMLWYTYDAHKNNPAADEFGNTREYIKQWFNNPLVLTRGQLGL